MATEFMDPYAGSKQHTDDSKRRLLAAVSQAGTAGKKAFDDAHAGIVEQQKAALQRAQQAASMFGGGEARFGSNEVQDRFGQQAGNVQAAGADFQAYNQAMGAAGSGYMDKVNAALGALRAQNDRAGIDYENQIKAFIANKEAEAEAARKAEADRRAWEERMFNMKEDRADARAVAKAQSDAAESAAKENKLTKPRLLGAGQTLSDQYDAFLGEKPGSAKSFTADQSARALAAYKGIDPTEVNTLLGPRELPRPKIEVPLMTEDFVKNRVGGKAAKVYDKWKNAPEIKQVDNFLGQLVNTKVRNGRIDDPAAGPAHGMTPKEAFEFYLDSLPGYATMKDSMRKLYVPWIEQNLGR